VGGTVVVVAILVVGARVELVAPERTFTGVDVVGAGDDGFAPGSETANPTAVPAIASNAATTIARVLPRRSLRRWRGADR
jgi:hypothetical protein